MAGATPRSRSSSELRRVRLRRLTARTGPPPPPQSRRRRGHRRERGLLATSIGADARNIPIGGLVIVVVGTILRRRVENSLHVCRVVLLLHLGLEVVIRAEDISGLGYGKLLAENVRRERGAVPLAEVFLAPP